MRARHWLSKLLLRQGTLYEVSAWTAHGKWLRTVQSRRAGGPVRVDEGLDAVLTTSARRDRLDAQIALMATEPAWAPIVGRLGCLRGVGTLTGFRVGRRTRRLAPVHRKKHRPVRRFGADRELQRRFTFPGFDHQDRQQPRPPVGVESLTLAPPQTVSVVDGDAGWIEMRPAGHDPAAEERRRQL